MRNVQGEPVLLVNCWDDSNKGDAAITIGTLNMFKANRLAESFQVSSYVTHANTDEMNHGFRHVLHAHPQVDLVPCYFPALSRSIGKAAALFRSLRCAFKLLLPGFIPDTPLDNAVRTAKMVVSNGGLYFGFRPTSTFNMLYHLFAFSYPMMLAKRLGVPYVLFSQSFGPFPSPLSRAWMRSLVNHSEGTWCRESFSAEALRKIGAEDARLKVIPDAAFGITSRENAALDQIPLAGLRSGEYVALSLRSLVPAGFSAEAEQTYLRSFGKLIEWIVAEKKMTVVLVAHTLGPIEDEDDRITTRAVYGALRPEVAVNVVMCELDLSPQQLCTLYGNSELVVATRFHAVILSLCGGTPVIAIPYFGIKTQGALKDMGLSSYTLEVGKIDAAVLQEKVAFCLQESSTARSEISLITKRLHEGAMRSGAMLKEVASGKPAAEPVNV
jgi:colanic acid/amylovoran biosynthesis protein